MVPRGRGRPPTCVDKRFDQLTQIVGTLVNTPSKIRLHQTHTKGTRETAERRQEVFGSRTHTRGSMGNRQRRAQEMEAAADGGNQPSGDRGGLLPRPPRRDVVSRESVSVHNQRDLRERLQARRNTSSHLMEGTLTGSPNRPVRRENQPERPLGAVYRAYGSAWVLRRNHVQDLQKHLVLGKLTLVYEAVAKFHHQLRGSEESLLQPVLGQVVATEEISDEGALMGAMSSTRHDIPFRDDLNQKLAKTYQEFLERAQGFINAEEAKSLALKSKTVMPKNVNNVDQWNEKQNGKKKQKEQSGMKNASHIGGKRDYRHDNHKRQCPDDELRRNHPQSRYNTYQNLTMSIDEIYHSPFLRRPKPLRSNPTK
ncbi:hypothetical protein TIFTF001_012162 [Ficus carica]|uniref:Uncharacterized protein n=1 Tax=Ficus carica TaxID=3494 RepID=A0AA87ZYI5_FICCA|nr:hypothetical protein TIFTF001_012162 [Ficus carica]